MCRFVFVSKKWQKKNVFFRHCIMKDLFTLPCERNICVHNTLLDSSGINLLANNYVIVVIEGYIYINFMEFFGSYCWIILMSHLFYIKFYGVFLEVTAELYWWATSFILNFMEFFGSYCWFILMSHLFYIKFYGVFWKLLLN